jgi:hypothetical protein
MALITTIYGEMDEALLEKRIPDPVDNDNELTHAVEYWLNGELVHRSVHVHLKQGIDLAAVVQDLA